VRARATSTVLAALLAAGLSGCTLIAPQTNQRPYDPSDGVGTSVGDVEIRNALLISDDGETANLVVNMVNSGSENVTLLVSWESATGGAERNVYIPAGEAEGFGKSSNQIILNSIDTELGSLYPVYFQYGDFEGDELMVPVYDGTLKEYADLVPKGTETDGGTEEIGADDTTTEDTGSQSGEGEPETDQGSDE